MPIFRNDFIEGFIRHKREIARFSLQSETNCLFDWHTACWTFTPVEYCGNPDWIALIQPGVARKRQRRVNGLGCRKML